MMTNSEYPTLDDCRIREGEYPRWLNYVAIRYLVKAEVNIPLKRLYRWDSLIHFALSHAAGSSNFIDHWGTLISEAGEEYFLTEPYGVFADESNQAAASLGLEAVVGGQQAIHDPKCTPHIFICTTECWSLIVEFVVRLIDLVIFEYDPTTEKKGVQYA